MGSVTRVGGMGEARRRAVMTMPMEEGGGDNDELRREQKGGRRTVFAEAYFFSVETPPWRNAAFIAADPLTTFSRGAPPPRVLLPILVSVLQSSMVAV